MPHAKGFCWLKRFSFIKHANLGTYYIEAVHAMYLLRTQLLLLLVSLAAQRVLCIPFLYRIRECFWERWRGH
jgi:hypothetical protein